MIISSDSVHNFVLGWEQKILENGCVLTKRSAVIPTVEFMREVLPRDGEIQFYCGTGKKSEDFIKTLEK